MPRKNPRILRKPGGEPVSRRLLTARVIGAVSGLDFSLWEMLKAGAEVRRRAAYLLGDGSLLLTAEISKAVREVDDTVERMMTAIAKLRKLAEKSDDDIRKLE